MPRPTRIQYKDAFYHVMNRGQNRQRIFHSNAHYQAFLETLAEASERFQLVVHAYCLMGNHYHLLLQTPNANLTRIMRHINGVYTQRYNRMKKTDGSLFRGRYKAIVVDEDSYLLQLSRYIHLNPIETKTPLVSRLEDYPWSSYCAYINKAPAPGWLQRDRTYQMLGQRNKYQGYARYIEQGTDQDVKRFYNKGNTASVIGNKEFVDWLLKEKSGALDDKTVMTTMLPQALGIADFVQQIANYYKLDAKALTTMVKGSTKGLMARKLAMYSCQQFGGFTLKEIMHYFGLSNIGSVSYITCNIRRAIKDDRSLDRQVQKLKDYIVYNAT